MTGRILAVVVVWWWLASTGTVPGPTDLGRTPGGVPVPAGTPYAAEFNDAGRRHGIDPAVLSAIARCESGYDPMAVSPAGAQGLMQFMPATAAHYRVDPWDPPSAVDGAARYLADSIDQFGTRAPAVLAASYNAGPGAVARYGGVPPYAETRRYVDCVTGQL